MCRTNNKILTIFLSPNQQIEGSAGKKLMIN